MSHNHSHGIKDYSFAFAIGITLNVLFVIVEVAFGIYADSLALIADAGHNLSDVLSLILAWGAATLATRASTETRTYGYRKLTIMASLASGIILLLALGGITWEALGRFMTPAPVAGPIVIVVASIGVVINTITALLFVSGQKHDLNIRGAFLHMAADAGVSLGVVVAGVLIMIKGWFWIDPVISLGISAVILWGTWGLLRDSVNLAIDAVPGGTDISGIREYLNGLERVSAIHDLHVWAMSTTEVALTVHLVVADTAGDNELLEEVQKKLHDDFGIEHTTVQVERADNQYECLLDNHRCL
jgi:cobalt-zinc-cadmium efflux system protein